MTFEPTETGTRMVFELRGVPAKPSDDIYDGWVEALDGTPRVIPIAFHFDGSRFVLGTIDQPTLVLMVRGTAEVSFVDGVLPEYLEATRKMFSAAAFPAFEAEVRRLYDRMARIDITPT